MEESDMEKHAGWKQVAENTSLAAQDFHASALNFDSCCMAH